MVSNDRPIAAVASKYGIPDRLGSVVCADGRVAWRVLSHREYARRAAVGVAVGGECIVVVSVLLLLGLVAMLLLIVLTIWYMSSAGRTSSWAAWLMMPYMLWLIFATYLNWYVYANN